MKTFNIDGITFQYYNGPEYTDAHNELWAACAACGRRMRVSRGVDSDALAQVLAEDYAFGPHRHTCEVAPVTDGEIVATSLWAVGDRVEAGDTPEDYDTGRVIALGEDALDAVSPRASGFVSPVAVAWDSGVRAVHEALDLREEGEKPYPAAGA